MSTPTYPNHSRRRRLLLGLAAASLATAACQKEELRAAQPTPAASSSAAAAPLLWNPGTIPASGAPADLLVAPGKLNPLSVRRSGVPIYKSNNPEIITGTGWLMQNARKAAGRGGRKFHLTGKNIIYLFHINKSGAPKYLHVLAVNPSSTVPTSVAYRGSCYTNATYPLTGAATGQSYHVAKNWLTGTFPITGSTGEFANGSVKELFKLPMANSNMIDGRVEVTSTKPTIYYVVATANGTPSEATAAVQGSFAAGEYFSEDRNRFGREAGIYATSEVTADNAFDLPASPAFIGFCLNTTNKFAPALESQTADSLMVLKSSASKTYGNYGHFYKLKFTLKNATGAARRVKAYFASNATNATLTNATWNGMVRSNGAPFNVYTTLNNPRFPLNEWTINPGQFVHTLEFYVPGLITTNQQLIFQVN